MDDKGQKDNIHWVVEWIDKYLYLFTLKLSLLHLNPQLFIRYIHYGISDRVIDWRFYSIFNYISSLKKLNKIDINKRIIHKKLK